MVWLHSGMVTISSSGFEWAWKSLVFLVFPAVFARLFVTQQRRRNGRRLVHKVMNNGFEILDKVNFSFDLRVNFRSILRAILSSSLGNIARKNFFRVLKKSSGHSWDILAFSCEMWRSAAHLVEGTPDFLRSNSLKQNDPLSAWRATRRQRLHGLYFGRDQALFLLFKPLVHRQHIIKSN